MNMKYRTNVRRSSSSDRYVFYRASFYLLLARNSTIIVRKQAARREETGRAKAEKAYDRTNKPSARMEVRDGPGEEKINRTEGIKGNGRL